MPTQKIPTDSMIRRLTASQRELLIDHIDGEVDVVTANHHMTGVRGSLMKAGLLLGTATKRPRTTILTEPGRRAVGMVLGDYADALVRAGLLEQENPLQVLQSLKAARRELERPSDLAVMMREEGQTVPTRRRA